MKQYISTVILVTIICASCGTSNEKAITESFLENLSASNEILWQSNNLLLSSLEEKAADRFYGSAYVTPLQKATKADAVSADMLHIIDELSRQPGITKQKGHLLYTHLLEYRSDMLAIDSNATGECRKKAIFFSKNLDSVSITEDRFRNHFFSGSDSQRDKDLLIKFRNNILLTENVFLTYFHNNTSYDKIIIDDFQVPLVTQNSTQLSPGETLEITAGMGEFTTMPGQEVYIGGTPVPVFENAARYTVKIPNKPGKHFIPVQIRYTDRATGKENVFEKNISYTVIKPNSE